MKTLHNFIIALIISLPMMGMSQIDEKQIMEETKEVFTFNGAPTLLMGTWHMGATSDAQTSSYNASLSHRIDEMDQLAKQIALFKPTKIFVEVTPENQKKMEEHYQAYLKNPDSLSTYHGEVGLLAFQIARLTGAKLVATDHKLGYDYGSISTLAQETRNKDYFSYLQQVGPFLQKVEALEKQATTKQLYRFTNTAQYLDFLFNINADLMTYVNTDGKFEGADAAADYYRRNLRIFANFNRTAISPGDKVLVLYGASHVAFFHDFMKRSHKYDVKDIQEFLK
jgi:hypothetical protein